MAILSVMDGAAAVALHPEGVDRNVLVDKLI